MTKGLHKNSLRKGEPNKWIVEDIIEKIRAEIERISSRAMNGDGQDICEYLLSFLDSIESEKPMNLEDLKGEIEMEWDSFNKHLAEYDDGDSDEVIWLNKFSFTDIARHFAQWQKEQMMDEWLKDRDGCFWGAPCTNPQHDCINCPRQGATGPYSTDTNIK